MEITLTIDGKTVTADSGDTLLDAARKAGASIPTLCQDDRLHPYGACRICMVEVEGPPRRMLPSCTAPAAEGMSVLTDTPGLRGARMSILELLLINHPLDCPVCDKAGECRLQDLVHEYGLGPGMFTEEKRTSPVDYASPVIERNRNRCILCGKCVRICKEQCGVGALTFSMRGGNSRIGTAFDRPLDCEFCGECLEICPVGALTAKQSKHKARPWNVEQVSSACIYCGNGCPLTAERRGNEIVRVRSAGDHYLCARGRFGWDAIHHPERLLLPKIRICGNLADCSWDEALSAVATNLNVIRNRYGPDHIGGLGSVRTTNEDNYVFQKFMRAVVRTNNVDLLARKSLPSGLNSVFFSGDPARLGEHEVILVLDKDAGGINPLTGIEIIRAVNRGSSRLIVADNGPNKFTRIASVVIPGDRRAAMERLIAGLRTSGRIVSSRLKDAVDLLSSAKSVAIVLPARLSPDDLALVRELATPLKRVTYYPLIPRGNIQGALDMGLLPDFLPGFRAAGPGALAEFAEKWGVTLPAGPGLNADEMMSGIGQGRIAGLYIMGDDPVGSGDTAIEDLRPLEFLIVQDIFLTETAKAAHVVLPAASFLERSGTITTVERRLREISKVIDPPGEARPDWQIIQSLAQRLGAPVNYASEADIMKEIRTTATMYRNLSPGSCWQASESPLIGTFAGLSLQPGSEDDDRASSEGELFSSGMMTTRSAELASILAARSRRARLKTS